MADKLEVIAFLIDTPGGTRRRRVMVKPTSPPGAPSTIEIPSKIEQSQGAITQYLASKTTTPTEGITWRRPLRK